MCLRTVLFLFLSGGVVAAQVPATVDLDPGAPVQVKLANGRSATVKLLSVSESRDQVRHAVRDARVEVEIDGSRAALSCGNYRLPVKVAGVQADCPVTKDYYADSNADHWSLVKAARVRLWPAGSPWPAPRSMLYPARQRWFATQTQMTNEPTYVDGGEGFEKRRIYYHSGLDIGGAEGLTEVVSATDGVAVGVGKNLLDEHKTGTFGPRYDAVYVLDGRGWYHCYLHLYSIDPAFSNPRMILKRVCRF